MTILEEEPSFFLKYRYWILSLIVFLLAFLHLSFGGIDPRSDFWEHTAVIRELATHPFSPSHPQFLLNVQHPFFSPFSLGIAWIVIITGLPSATVLTIFSFINLAFFLFCLKLFTDSLLNKRASFYVLLFLLFLWGYRPWLYSSFFNLNSFFCTFSYPSFFCVSLTFLSFYIYTRILLYNKILYYILLLLISIFILITHPFTAIFLYIGLISLLLYYCNLSQYFQYLLLISLIMLSFIISFAWPYFPLYRLISSNSSEFSYLTYELYRYFPIRIFPALVGVPLIVLRLRKNYFDPLGLMFIGLSSLYLYGFISENYNYGRQISYIVIILQICIADWVTAIELKYLSGGYNYFLNRLFKLAVIAFSLMIIGTLVMQGYSYMIHWNRNYSYHNFVFLSRYTEQYDVILSDIETSWLIPTFGGKIVAAFHAQAFVPDHSKRKDDLTRFFSKEASRKGRLDIIAKYKAKYILLNKDRIQLSPEVICACQSLGTIIYSKSNFILIKLDDKRS